MTRFCIIVTVNYMNTYATLSSREKTSISFKKFLDDTFFTFACFLKHSFSKYWGKDAWTVPHLKFLGDRLPQSPLSLRPCWVILVTETATEQNLLVRRPCSSHHHQLSLGGACTNFTRAVEGGVLYAYMRLTLAIAQ